VYSGCAGKALEPHSGVACSSQARPLAGGATRIERFKEGVPRVLELLVKKFINTHASLYTPLFFVVLYFLH
jgi:hypothetical protein